jgi:hypothetical protein
MKEYDVRQKVKALKSLYKDLSLYVAVNALFILIWAVFNRGETFWPKYILLIWGIALVVQAYRRGLLPLILYHLSFLTPEWEERKVEELVGRKGRSQQRKIRLNRDAK